MSTVHEQSGSSTQARAGGQLDPSEATRLLEVAAHDIAVASTCIGLGDLDEAHTNVLTARVAADAAEEILRLVLRQQSEGTAGA